MTDAQRETPVPKGHEACDSTSMKCSEELHPWRREADDWLPGAGGGGHRVSFWGDENVLQLAEMAAQLCECTKNQRIVCAGVVRCMACESYLRVGGLVFF